MPKGTFIQKGKTIDYKNASEAEIGYNDVIPATTRICIAGENIAVGATGSVHTDGIYELPAVNDAAFAVGDKLFWDSTAGKLCKVELNNTPAGWCTEPKALAGTLAKVKID